MRRGARAEAICLGSDALPVQMPSCDFKTQAGANMSDERITRFEQRREELNKLTDEQLKVAQKRAAGLLGATTA